MERETTHEASPAPSLDARMEKAISACLQNPDLKFIDALLVAGFEFFGSNTDDTASFSSPYENNVVDSDLVTLRDRVVELKTHLNLRITERTSNSTKNGGGGSSSSCSSSPPTPPVVFYEEEGLLLPGGKTSNEEDDISSNAAVEVLHDWTRELLLRDSSSMISMRPPCTSPKEEKEPPTTAAGVASSPTTPAPQDDGCLCRFDISDFIRNKTVGRRPLPLLPGDQSRDFPWCNKKEGIATKKFACSTEHEGNGVFQEQSRTIQFATESNKKEEVCAAFTSSSSLTVRSAWEQQFEPSKVSPPQRQAPKEEGFSLENYDLVWGAPGEEDDRSLEESFMRNYGMSLSQFWDKVYEICGPTKGLKEEEDITLSSLPSPPLLLSQRVEEDDADNMCNRYSRALATLQKEKELLLRQCMRSAGFEEKEISGPSPAHSLLAFEALKVDVGERWPSVLVSHTSKKNCHAKRVVNKGRPTFAKRKRQRTRIQQHC